MTKIKICGLTNGNDILYANELKPDYIGFVFAAGRRQITPTDACELKRALLPGIQAVGVFVNADVAEIAEIANRGIIDLIQLHGDETIDDICVLRTMTNAPIIKVIRVKTADDFCTADRYPCDYLLFDTYTKDAYGGSGLTFDWSLLPPMNKPYFLAGGLNQDNILQAASTPAWCLDVSSGVETDGKKDRLKIKQLIETIRR